jgi:pimeloyl-ACP methyl ester carboxylesterase
LLVMLHGARDTSASFQFLVDALDPNWHVVCPDWRGHGQSGWTPGNYWLSDFLSDLDVLLTQLFAGREFALLGHSMGGNIAGAYAGLRPDRLTHLVMLDALGNPLDRSPVRLAEVLLQLLNVEASSPKFYSYPDVSEMSTRLMKSNRGLDAARATFLARANSRLLPEGGLAWAWDPAFRKSWPSVHSTEEWAELWQRITAPTLCILSSDPRPKAATSDPDAIRDRSRHFRNFTLRVVPDTGHNVHIDAPTHVAREIESFTHAR